MLLRGHPLTARGRSAALTSFWGKCRALQTDRSDTHGTNLHIGKEGNHLEAHPAGVISKTERQLECHDSDFEDLVDALREIPSKVIAEATGYKPRTVRRLKCGEFLPSPERRADLVQLLAGRIPDGASTILEQYDSSG